MLKHNTWRCLNYTCSAITPLFVCLGYPLGRQIAERVQFGYISGRTKTPPPFTYQLFFKYCQVNANSMKFGELIHPNKVLFNDEEAELALCCQEQIYIRLTNGRLKSLVWR